MSILLMILVIAAIAGGVFWNKRNAAAAIEGVRFHVPTSPQATAAALRDAHCSGTKAAVRGAALGVRATQTGATSFRVESRFGDVGTIEVAPDGPGAVVTARAGHLYVGSPQAVQFRSGLMGLSSAIVHRINVLLGVCPGAARMKRFHRGIETRTTRQLQRSTQA